MSPLILRWHFMACSRPTKTFSGRGSGQRAGLRCSINWRTNAGKASALRELENERPLVFLPPEALLAHLLHLIHHHCSLCASTPFFEEYPASGHALTPTAQRC